MSSAKEIYHAFKTEYNKTPVRVKVTLLHSGVLVNAPCPLVYACNRASLLGTSQGVRVVTLLCRCLSAHRLSIPSWCTLC